MFVLPSTLYSDVVAMFSAILGPAITNTATSTKVDLNCSISTANFLQTVVRI